MNANTHKHIGDVACVCVCVCVFVCVCVCVLTCVCMASFGGMNMNSSGFCRVCKIMLDSSRAVAVTARHSHSKLQSHKQGTAAKCHYI